MPTQNLKNSGLSRCGVFVYIASLGGKGWKILTVGPALALVFPSIFDNSRKIMGQATFVTFAPKHYNIITRMRQASTCGRVRATGPTPSAPKQWKSDVRFMS